MSVFPQSRRFGRAAVLVPSLIKCLLKKPQRGFFRRQEPHNFTKSVFLTGFMDCRHCNKVYSQKNVAPLLREMRGVIQICAKKLHLNKAVVPVAKAIVTAHGGKIQADTQTGHDFRITTSFPA